MLIDREQFEKRELSTLAPYAVKSALSRGRAYPEPEDPYRTCFQRDRDRVIHSKAFRRLRGKTQVFIASYGDHYRSRSAHSMEVAQFSRDIARMLNLNEDLAEAIALAHDLGHTPFGHAGQDAMHACMQAYGSRFEHNEQSRRIVDFFEEKSPDFPGLNLSFEVRDGLLKHRTVYDQPLMTDTLMPSLEAQVANIADEIAYNSHDIDDGLRSGIITVEQLKKLALWQRVEKQISEKIPFDLRVGTIISALVTWMVNDFGQQTSARLVQEKIQSVEQLYELPKSLAAFSDEMQQMADELKNFLYQHFYQSPQVAEYNSEGKKVIQALFEKMMKDQTLLPEKFQKRLSLEGAHVVVKDYIAGMTDNFALELYNELQ